MKLSKLWWWWMSGEYVAPVEEPILMEDEGNLLMENEGDILIQ